MVAMVNGITVTDGLTALGYLIPALICVVYAIRVTDILPGDEISAHRILWWSASAVLILLGIYRLLDLQYIFADMGRTVAKMNAWHDHRFVFQAFVVIGIGIMGLILLSTAESTRPYVWRYHRWFLCALVFSVCYTIISTLSYHPIDQILNREMGGVRLSAIIEMGNVAWIGITLIGNFHRLTKHQLPTVVSSSRYI